MSCAFQALFAPGEFTSARASAILTFSYQRWNASLLVLLLQLVADSVSKAASSVQTLPTLRSGSSLRSYKQPMSANLPSLVSFPSWEYDVASAVSSSGCIASTASFDVSVSTAGGGGNANSYAIPSGSSTSTFTASTISSTSAFAAAGNTKASGATRRGSASVEVLVSGCRFTIPAATYSKLWVLPWEGSQRNMLRTCPKLFEIILNHLLFDTYPDVGSLSVSDVEELEPMAILLELNGLVQHLLAHRHKARPDGVDRKKLPKGTKSSRVFRLWQDTRQHEQRNVAGQVPVSRPRHKTLQRASSSPAEVVNPAPNRKLLWTARAQWKALQNPRTAACDWDKIVQPVRDASLDEFSPSWMEIRRTLS